MALTRLLILSSLIALKATAQQPQHDGDGQLPSWQQVWHDTMEAGDIEQEEQADSYFDLLQQLHDHPLDLNRASREQLEQLPFLSAQQVMDFMEYRQRYGPLFSMGEVRMVRSMDHQQLSLLPFFTYIGEVADTVRFPQWKTIVKNGKNELIASVRYPFYDRAGDRNGYLGYKMRHWLRYEHSYGSFARLGLLGSQDAGEPFFANRNGWGYDNYSFFVQIRQLGCIDNMVAGKFKLSAGLGLVLNNSFSLGKLNTLQNLGRLTTTIRPHASLSVADYFQGAAATISLSGPLKLTLFASYRPVDATLNADGSMATLLSTGYHRTPKEMEKKHNSHQTATGMHIAFSHNALHIGATAVYTHFDRELRPNKKELYRRYYAQGSNFVNASIDYRLMLHRMALNGEMAIDKNGALATINALSYQAASDMSIVMVQRFYSYRYATLHGHAFSEGGHVQNESGIYIGGSWQPLSRLQLRGYADYAYFPWARYQVAQSSSATDFLIEATVTASRQLTMKGRYRLHHRQPDASEHRARLTAVYSEGEWQATTQADYVMAESNSRSHGWMVSQNGTWKHSFWQTSLMAAYFDTQSYDSRIYAYERQLPHTFAFPMYYGNGMRLALVGRANIQQWLQIDAKVGVTRYFDRSVTGSGLQRINGSTMTDAEVQMRWRF